MKTVTLYKVSTETILVENMRDYLEVYRCASIPERILNSDEVVVDRTNEPDKTPIYKLCRNNNGVSKQWYVAYDKDIKNLLAEYTATTEERFGELRYKIQERDLDLGVANTAISNLTLELKMYQDMSFWQRLKWALTKEA